MKHFGMLGVAGYIAPRHLGAIRDNSGVLVAAMDVSDSVGVLDSYFPDCRFFGEFEYFAEWILDETFSDRRLDFLIVCSPNHLHVPHVKFALSNGINVICEKPLALRTDDLNALKKYEERYSSQVFTILQLRLHPEIISLRRRVSSNKSDHKYEVDVTYITSRGDWYLRSWKADDARSGGLATNIGIHLFDMLHFVFGASISSKVYWRDVDTVSGCLEFKDATVTWLLSIDSSLLQYLPVTQGQRTFRNISVNGESIEFSGGFTDLHSISYREILDGKGFGVDDSYAAVQTVENIRTCNVSRRGLGMHPLLEKLK